MRQAHARRTIALSAAAVLTAGLAVSAPAFADGKQVKPKAAVATTDADRLATAVTVNGQLKHLRQLQVIANRNEGNRASGLPGHTASADYVASTLKQAGYVVKRQTFTFPFSRDVEPATLALTEPTATDIETAAFQYSGSGEVTGPLVPIDLTLPPAAEPSSTSGCEAEDFPAPPSEDAVALLQRGTCDFGLKAANAEVAGYAAAIIFNEGQEGRQELLTGTLGASVGIPTVGISFEDGQTLATTEGATVKVTAKTENDPNRKTENVIANLPASSKTKNPGQAVVVGAHLDSVAEGPGINDNGTGSAALLEIALQLRKLKIDKKLQRPVRFVFFGAEEAGLLGSQHYVDSLTDLQRSRIYANLNFDMLGSPNYVRFVYDGNGSATDLGGEAGPAGSAQIEKVFTNYYGAKKLATEPTAFDGRSDYGPFIEYGIPAGGLFSGAEEIKTEEEAATYGGTAGEAYDSCYHQACDDITNLSTQGISELGDGAAYATVRIAQSKLGLYGDAPRPKIKTKAQVKAQKTALKRQGKATRATAHGEHALTR